ncbi:hypothetical protein E4U19_003021 [Claviceps sp. Clav32 group G5]|nr:hypothetical protein E4U19_003021 [Claviceps sp. Clav32 group G5]KAG6027344.1 hypothetical protein E4U40_001615 [Claviceps sp. LM458 group G5]KAG6043373.1 hypothetical protein E4U39_004602 [Claviceps sp. Clav50 group G5]
MRSTAILSAILAASTATQALILVTEPSANTTMTLAPPPLTIKPSEAPIPSGNATATGLPPVPTAPRPGSSDVPIAGAAMNAQNSLLAMGVVIFMAVLTL